MTLSLPYRFAVVIFAEDRTNLGTVPVKHDFEPAHEWTRFYFQRKGHLGLAANGCASTVIPIFDSTLGEPYCRGYRIQITPPAGHPVSMDFPNTDFRDFASAVASIYVEQKKLRAGEIFTYLVVAHPAPQQAQKPGGLSVIDSSPTLPVHDASLASFLARATPCGVIEADDMPVFISRQVLDDAAAQTHAEEGTETGGILIGKLWRDQAASEVFAEVTAMIPADHTNGTNVKLTFTPQTFAAADAAMRLRKRNEQFAGYFHSHPVKTWCRAKGCDLEAQKSCRLAKDFFSEDDVSVLRAAFGSPYQIAIVANDTAFTDLTFSMFGNRRGITQPRGFYVLEENTHGA